MHVQQRSPDRRSSSHSLRTAILVLDFVALACPLVYLGFSRPSSTLGLYYVLGASALVVATLFLLWSSTAAGSGEE